MQLYNLVGSSHMDTCMKDKQLQRLRATRRKVINSMLEFEAERDKLLFNDKGEYAPDWEAYTLLGNKSLNFIEEIEKIQKQIYELQN